MQILILWSGSSPSPGLRHSLHSTWVKPVPQQDHTPPGILGPHLLGHCTCQAHWVRFRNTWWRDRGMGCSQLLQATVLTLSMLWFCAISGVHTGKWSGTSLTVALCLFCSGAGVQLLGCGLQHEGGSRGTGGTSTFNSCFPLGHTHSTFLPPQCSALRSASFSGQNQALTLDCDAPWSFHTWPFCASRHWPCRGPCPSVPRQAWLKEAWLQSAMTVGAIANLETSWRLVQRSLMMLELWCSICAVSWRHCSSLSFLTKPQAFLTL